MDWETESIHEHCTYAPWVFRLQAGNHLARLLKVNRAYMATLGFLAFEWPLVVEEGAGLIGRFGAHIAAVGVAEDAAA